MSILSYNICNDESQSTQALGINMTNNLSYGVDLSIPASKVQIKIPYRIKGTYLVVSGFSKWGIEEAICQALGKKHTHSSINLPELANNPQWVQQQLETFSKFFSKVITVKTTVTYTEEQKITSSRTNSKGEVVTTVKVKQVNKSKPCNPKVIVREDLLYNGIYYPKGTCINAFLTKYHDKKLGDVKTPEQRQLFQELNYLNLAIREDGVNEELTSRYKEVKSQLKASQETYLKDATVSIPVVFVGMLYAQMLQLYLEGKVELTMEGLAEALSHNGKWKVNEFKVIKQRLDAPLGKNDETTTLLDKIEYEGEDNTLSSSNPKAKALCDYLIKKVLLNCNDTQRKYLSYISQLWLAGKIPTILISNFNDSAYQKVSVDGKIQPLSNYLVKILGVKPNTLSILKTKVNKMIIDEVNVYKNESLSNSYEDVESTGFYFKPISKSKMERLMEGMRIG